MLKQYFFGLIFFLILAAAYIPITNLPKTYFQLPIAGDVSLTGNFGELRPHHFHTGWDLKAPVGTPVMACADGYVSYMQHTPRGYGKMLTITHPNGFTTAYAHLDSFANSLEKIATDRFQQQKTTKLTLSKADKLFVKKGEVIAFVGMSGTTFGPHLHWEIRPSLMLGALNPALLGQELLADTKPPFFKLLKWYEGNQDGVVFRAETIDTEQKEGDLYCLKGRDTLFANYRYTSFGIEAWDNADALTNLLGVYSIIVSANNQNVYTYRADSLAFADNSNYDTHLDYNEWAKQNRFIQRCHVLLGNASPLYNAPQRGYIDLNKADSICQIDIKIADFHKNTANLSFVLVRKNTDFKLPIIYPPSFFLPFGKSVICNTKNVAVYIPSDALFTPTFLKLDIKKDESAAIASAVYSFSSNDDMPFKTAATISFYNLNIPSSLRSKAIIAACAEDGFIPYETQDKGDTLSTFLPTWGDYLVVLDTIPPTVKWLPIHKNTFSIQLSDNLSGWNTCTATIDGMTVKENLERQNDIFSYTFPFERQRKTHTIVLTVSDIKSNTRTLSQTFFY